jgi:hypothetical protein
VGVPSRGWSVSGSGRMPVSLVHPPHCEPAEALDLCFGGNRDRFQSPSPAPISAPSPILHYLDRSLANRTGDVKKFKPPAHRLPAPLWRSGVSFDQEGRAHHKRHRRPQLPRSLPLIAPRSWLPFFNHISLSWKHDRSGEGGESRPRVLCAFIGAKRRALTRLPRSVHSRWKKWDHRSPRPLFFRCFFSTWQLRSPALPRGASVLLGTDVVTHRARSTQTLRPDCSAYFSAS